MRRHHSFVAALLLAISLAIAGCGSDDEAGLPTAGGETSSSDPGSGSESRDSRDEALLKVAQCLRDHGLDIEDPKPGEGLAVSVEGEDREKADAAMKACEKYAPAGEPDPEGVREEMLETAQCMREHGVESFPDPKPGEGISLEGSVAEDPDFAAAEEACMDGADSSSQGAP